MSPASGAGLKILETQRLNLRELNLEDAGFILELLNEPAFVRFIGDRGVKNLSDARAYLTGGPIASYARYGFGLWLVQLKSTGESLGICGLVKRDTLPDFDIGYAFLERYWLKGYASEAAQAVKTYALEVLGVKRLMAVTDQENAGSIKVIEKIGLKYEGLVRITENGAELKLFSLSTE